ncbi:THUMP domain-containing protein 1 homolog [Sitophilus oryzae]|uniref:THUMP domain-containing protein 1 homolog n=1 Tax=Sitophilus oryzae TaxID=7048 RepID=A0A6J2YRQ1_SITOR|nr:THUMP domain-containing protein 1 homolog [Sitophilus oryzae]
MSKIEKVKYRQQYSKKSSRRRYNLDVNQKGFLCSCNNREKDCIREAYNILNKYADILWPANIPQSTSSQNEIEDDLQKELQELKNDKNEKRFQVVESGAKNFLFIKTTVEDPVKLAESILNDLSENKSQGTKFLLRLVPIEVTCKAYMKDIEKSFETLCVKYFSEKPRTFSIVFNHRNNNSVSRDDVIESLANMVSKMGQENNLEHKVDLKNAELSIVIEIIRGFACLGVAPNFIKLKKYNLLAFCSSEPESDVAEKVVEVSGSEENK